MNASQISDRLSAMREQRFSAARSRLPSRFSALLTTLLVLIIAQPFLAGHQLAAILMNIFISGVLVAGVYAISQKRRDLFVGCFFALPALLGRWFSHFVEHPFLFIASSI